MNNIVSGLERSGTSLLMQILEAGGLQVAYSNTRKPDENNPNGYYELEGGKIISRLMKGSFPLEKYKDKFIKITAYGLHFLPKGEYQIIFIKRDIEEILISMEKMTDGEFDKDEVRPFLLKLLDFSEKLLIERDNISVLFLDYNNLIENPEHELQMIEGFLDGFNIEKAKKVIDKKLYRSKKMRTMKEALKFLQDEIKKSKYIENPSAFEEHGKIISSIIGRTLEGVKDLDIDVTEMEIAGLLHDIGRCVSSDSLHHPITGAEYLEKKGLKRISKIIKTHNFIKEVVEETKYKNINPKDLDIKTWNEALITHASMICGKGGKIVSFDEKLEHQRKNRDDFFRKISKKGEKRIREIYDDVEKLKSGDKDIVSKYGVL